MLLRLLGRWRRKPREGPQLVLFSRPGCHLCEEMKDVLARAKVVPRFRLREVNIEEDPELLKRFERSIPVLEIAGRTAFKGRMSPADFRRKYARIVADSGPESSTD